MPPSEVRRREVARSVAELVGDGTRSIMTPADSKSGARFEWVVIAGERYVLKHQDVTNDWLMRATGDLGRRYVALWEHGILDRVPDGIDHATVGCAYDGRAGAVLLRDVSAGLLPTGDRLIAIESHRRFLDHMAALHAAFWGWRDKIGLTPLANRYLAMAPAVATAEAALGSTAPIPPLLAMGWSRLPSVAPALAALVLPLLDDLTALLTALGQVPHTFVHGDWKAGNPGEHPDGRTILIDWGEFPGEASPLADLTWYLALNAARLPESKDDTIATYRGALEGHGVATSGWWDGAVALELLATMVQFGWEKALAGPGPELDWWESAALRGAAHL